MVSPLLWLSPPTPDSATTTYELPQTRRQAVSNQQALGRNGPSRKSTGWKPSAATQTFRKRVLRSRR
ncbi:hypothetical protein U0070_003982 [Myodes glareolus]|uniref:Uncharacterized protein n=1 Tax=Myodes glareolus TaxID=447135 RepID=A0AAW0KBA3_MYOGA